MKKQLLFLFLMLLITNTTFSQETRNKTDETKTINQTEAINQKVKLFEQFLKTADENGIKNIISKNAEKHLEEKLVQMQKKLPKGNVFTEKISHSGKNDFLVVSQIKPFGIILRLVLDKNYLIKSAEVSSQENFELSDDYKLDINKIVLPFHLIDGYIFIDGKVNEKYGKFMYDTGTPFGLLLNNHYLELEKKDIVTKGSADSGKALDIYINSIDKIEMGNKINYKNLLSVPNSDLLFIEQGIEQDYLGFIGYDFYKNYEFIIDYDYQTITLYKTDKNGNVITPYTLPNTVLTTFHFTTLKKKQIPEVEIKLGKTTIKGSFDTGNQGRITLDESTKSNLIQQGILTLGNQGGVYGQDSDENNIYNINQLSNESNPLQLLKNYPLKESKENHIHLGYQFLKNYISVWNFRKKTITVLQK